MIFSCDESKKCAKNLPPTPVHVIEQESASAKKKKVEEKKVGYEEWSAVVDKNILIPKKRHASATKMV